MKKQIILSIFLISVMNAQEPLALSDMRKVYDSEVKKIDEKYVGWLNKKISEVSFDQKKFYEDEVAKVTGKSPTDASDPVVKKPIDNKWGKSISIDSKVLDGYRVGKLDVGDIVKLQYKEGVWNAYPAWGKENPDIASNPKHRLELVMKTNTGDKVITNPMHTSETPFEFVVDEKGEYFLRIGGRNSSTSNGVVEYKIEVLRK